MNKKVLHLNNGHLDNPFFSALIEEQKGLGFNATVFVAAKTGDPDFKNTSQDVIYKRCVKRLDKAYCIKQYYMKKALERSVEVKSFDLIHAYMLYTHGFLAYYYKRKYGIPYIVNIRNTDINKQMKYRKYLNPLAKRIISEAEKIVFVNPSYYRRVCENWLPKSMLKEFEKKHSIIPNGIEESWIDKSLKTKPKASKPLHILSIGKINKNKNYQALVKAAQILKEENINCEVTIIGKSYDKDIEKSLAKEPIVRILPQQNRQNLRKLYRECDIFVLPSKTETFGLVYLEAISQGTPVLYTENEGFDKQFPDGVVGYPIKPDNPSTIAAAIKRVIENYETLSENCLNGINRFTLPRIAKEYTDVYNEAISSKHYQVKEGKEER